MGKQRKWWQTLFFGLQNHCRWWLQPWNWKTFAPCRKSYDQTGQHIKKQRHYIANKGPPSQAYGFSSSRVWMWELDYKERWVPKNWSFWTMVLEKTLESPLDSKEINPKGNQSWIFIGRIDVEAKTPIFWPPDAKNWLIWKDLDAGKDWRQEEKGTTEDEMVGWHHRLNGVSLSKRWKLVMDREAWHAVEQSIMSHRVGHDWGTELNWTPSWPSMGIHCKSSSLCGYVSNLTDNEIHFLKKLFSMLLVLLYWIWVNIKKYF